MKIITKIGGWNGAVGYIAECLDADNVVGREINERGLSPDTPEWDEYVAQTCAAFGVYADTRAADEGEEEHDLTLADFDKYCRWAM